MPTWVVGNLDAGVRVGYAGEFTLTCRSKRGGQKWAAVVANGVKIAACDELNRLLFGSTAATARTFAIGLIDAAGFTATDPLDTVAAHPGWAEFTGYTPARPTWTQTGSSMGIIDSLTTLSVTATAAGSLKGLFLAAADLLYSTGEVTSPLAVAVGDALTMRYRVRAKARAGT